MTHAPFSIRPTPDLRARSAARTWVLAALAFGILGLAGCEANCSISTAKLSEESMASAINAETKAPTAAATTFAPDAQVIYATAKLSGAPDGTKVKATFHYLEGGERQIAADEVQAGGSRYVFFTLTPPVNGWPPGQYEARFYLDGKPGTRLPFNISAVPASRALEPLPQAGVAGSSSAQPPAPKPQAPSPSSSASTPEMKRFLDEKFGFTFELPMTWVYHVTPRKDYMFEGPKGTDAYEISIVLQFVLKSANPGSSTLAQARQLATQLQSEANAVIKTSDVAKIAGQSAPYFDATYTAKDSRGAAVSFSHTQFVLDHGEYYYLVSYAAPQPIYEKYLPAFQHMTRTFGFTF